MFSLKDIGYTAQRLKQQGYTAAELALGARGRVDLKAVTYAEDGTVKILAIGKDDGGYTAKEMRGGPPPHITANELRKGKVFFRVEEWKDGTWPTKELREAGYSSSEMRACGYMAPELRKNGYSFQDLVDAEFPIKNLRAIGAKAGELRDAGISAKTLSEVGYSAKELREAGFSPSELIACGYGVGELREAGFNAIQLRALGFSAAELKAYGYGAAALKEAGSVVKELKELGFPDEELEEAGFTRRAVEAVDGRSVRELKDPPRESTPQYPNPPSNASYSVAELKEYGFVSSELRGIYTVKDIKEQGFSLEELRAGGFPEHAVLAVDGRSTKELRKAGYVAAVLRKIGFVLYELAAGDYTATELKQALYGALELKEVGFSAGHLREAGFTSKQLRAAGYTLKQMQKGGYFWKDLVIFLKATHAELTKAGFKGLDPKHELFLLYRPDPDADKVPVPDVSVLSPMYTSERLVHNVMWGMGKSAAAAGAWASSMWHGLTSPGGGKMAPPPKDSEAGSEPPTGRGSSLEVAVRPGGTVATQRGAERTPLSTPRAASAAPGVLSTRPSKQSVRASARLQELGAPSRREEQAQQRAQQEAHIDERMDQRLDLQQV